MRLPRATALDRLPAAPLGPPRVGPARAAWTAGLGRPRPAFRLREASGPDLFEAEGVLGPEARVGGVDRDHYLRLPHHVSGRFVVGEGRDIALTRTAGAVAAPGLGLIDEFNVSRGSGVPEALLIGDLQAAPGGFTVPDGHVERVPGFSAPFCHYGLRAFGHFVLDGMLQVHLWERELRAGDARLVHWPFPDPWMQPALDALGLPRGSQRLLRRPAALLERAALSSALAGHGVYFPGAFSLRFFEWLKARFAVEAPASPSRLYVRRGDASARPVADAPELEALAVSHGYQIFEPEGLGLAEQIRVWTGAGTVLSPWGSTLTLAPLLAGPRQVVELLPGNVTDGWFFRQAMVHRLRYLPVLHPAASDGGFTADLEAVDRALRALA